MLWIGSFYICILLLRKDSHVWDVQGLGKQRYINSTSSCTTMHKRIRLAREAYRVAPWLGLYICIIWVKVHDIPINKVHWGMYFGVHREYSKKSSTYQKE